MDEKDSYVLCGRKNALKWETVSELFLWQMAEHTAGAAESAIRGKRKRSGPWMNNPGPFCMEK